MSPVAKSVPATAQAGGGVPILVVTTASNPFSSYYTEILRAEGLNEFNVADVASVSRPSLDAYDVVILGEAPLGPAQVSMFNDWVQAGGALIAMRPDKQLTQLLGLSDLASTLTNSYLRVDASSSPGAGIVSETMQFHGVADRYALNGATSVATLYSDAATATVNPAVALHSVGSQGGQAAAFTYDLARSIVYTRQGNPAWAGQARDGQSGPIRPDDLFFGAASFDPQPDWVDLNKVAIPQADEQQRLLANLIGEMDGHRKPLPHFWYFPNSAKAVVVMTGDDHGSGGTAGRFDNYKSASPAGCSVADWQCVRSTSYIYTNAPLTDQQAAAYTSQGFEVSLHLNTNCADWTPASLEAFYSDQLSTFSAKYASIPAPDTHRTHCVAWSDWATQPKVELAHGIRLDANYYYWPPSWIQDRPGLFTGSAIPMRFADVDGTTIDTYQATTQMTDESGQSYPSTADTLLDRAVGPEGYFGAFTANVHTDNAASSVSDAIVSSAQSRGVPIISARQLLTWLDGRNASSFQSLGWSGNQLSFTVGVGAGANGLEGMLPTNSAWGTLSTIKRNGSLLTFQTQTIKGVEYAFFAAAPGDYQATYSHSFTDSTTGDFGAGTTDPGTYVAKEGGGAVILKPTLGEEFSGASLPSGWSSTPWNPGGGATVANGKLTVDGAKANTDASYGAGHSLDFAATFGAEQFQHVGFADSGFNVWAIFSMNNTTNQVFARTNTGLGSPIDTPIPGNFVGSPHRYRIDWGASDVKFIVDGALVATHQVIFAANMSPTLSDFDTGAAVLSADWLHMSPYATQGTFLSRVFDAGGSVSWGALSWRAEVPTATTLAMNVRTGPTPTPDAGWSTFTPVANSGDVIGVNSRYIQYRADLGTADTNETPALQYVRIEYTPPAPAATTTTPGSPSIALGGSNTDGATVTGNATGGSPTGTVTFSVCGPLTSAAGCPSGGVAVGSAVSLTGGGSNTATATSASFTPNAVGTWCFRGDYSGDPKYSPSSDGSSGECFTVIAASDLTATGTSFNTREGKSRAGKVATFTDPGSTEPATSFSADVDWGDNTSSAGVVTGSAGSYTVSASHTYTDEGQFTVSVVITEKDGDTPAPTATATGTATVAEADQLTPSGRTFTARRGVAFARVLASFTDSVSNVATDFAIRITWGDGTPASTGTVSGSGNSFSVRGTHTYARTGTFTVTVTITDASPGTARAVASSSVRVS